VFMAWIVSAVAAFLVLCAAPAAAQDYPAKPIHILVPYAPGGITDIAARIVGAKLTEAWGQQVVVENKPGGNGFIAMSAGAKAAADGYTLTMVTVGDVAINPVLFKDMPYDVQRDFAPIALVSDAPMVLAANAGTPYKSVDEVIAAAKAQPGRISVSTPGNGSVNQIVLEWMALNTGTKFQHIPYKGGAPAAAALAGGDIPLGVLASWPCPRAGGDHGQALEAQSGMADPAGGRREGSGRLQLDRAVRAQGHAAGDRRQAQRRGGEDPQHARREGALRRRRRRGHPLERGGAGQARGAGIRTLQGDRAEGEHPAGLSQCVTARRSIGLMLRSARSARLEAWGRPILRDGRAATKLAEVA
jgi:Tripartite tricarboxylate transporter family receptor